jgi:hypothetical protein
MHIETRISRPEIVKIRIYNTGLFETGRQPEHELLEGWGWCSMEKVRRCLCRQGIGLDCGNLKDFVHRFAALNGHIGFRPVISYVYSECGADTRYAINRPVEEFDTSKDRGGDYLIPSRWAAKIVDLKTDHSAMLSVGNTPLYAVSVRISPPGAIGKTSGFSLWATAAGGNYWEIPTKLCPDLSVRET